MIPPVRAAAPPVGYLTGNAMSAMESPPNEDVLIDIILNAATKEFILDRKNKNGDTPLHAGKFFFFFNFLKKKKLSWLEIKKNFFN